MDGSCEEETAEGEDSHSQWGTRVQRKMCLHGNHINAHCRPDRLDESVSLRHTFPISPTKRNSGPSRRVYPGG